MQNMLNGSGKCGWICRQLNKIGGVIAVISIAIPVVGAYYIALKIAVDKADNLLFKTAIIEPTAEEEIIMNGFAEKLGNFIKDILLDLNNNSTNLTVVNRQLVKMAVLSEYFSTNETNGLSKNAIAIRHQLIQQAFAPIKEEIQAKNGALTGIPVSIQAIQSDFSSMFLNSVNGQFYTVRIYPNTATSATYNATAINAVKTVKNIDTAVIPETYLYTNDVLPKVNVSSVVYDETATIPSANINVNGVFYTPTDINGKFSLKNIDSNAIISISFVGYKTVQFPASQTPAKIVLQNDGELGEIEIKNNYKKKSNLFLVLLLVGALVYGGYRYSIDKKTNKVIKTKI